MASQPAHERLMANRQTGRQVTQRMAENWPATLELMKTICPFGNLLLSDARLLPTSTFFPGTYLLSSCVFCLQIIATQKNVGCALIAIPAPQCRAVADSKWASINVRQSS